MKLCPLGWCHRPFSTARGKQFDSLWLAHQWELLPNATKVTTTRCTPAPFESQNWDTFGSTSGKYQMLCSVQAPMAWGSSQPYIWEMIPLLLRTNPFPFKPLPLVPLILVSPSTVSLPSLGFSPFGYLAWPKPVSKRSPAVLDISFFVHRCICSRETDKWLPCGRGLMTPLGWQRRETGFPRQARMKSGGWSEWGRGTLRQPGRGSRVTCALCRYC